MPARSLKAQPTPAQFSHSTSALRSGNNKTRAVSGPRPTATRRLNYFPAAPDCLSPGRVIRGPARPDLTGVRARRGREGLFRGVFGFARRPIGRFNLRVVNLKCPRPERSASGTLFTAPGRRRRFTRGMRAPLKISPREFIEPAGLFTRRGPSRLSSNPGPRG